MRRIAHLSDIHFGRVDDVVAEAVIKTVHEQCPDVVVVSGDLTQRARSNEFKMAREFLDRLPKPQIVVPGNHDVPLYNLYQRFSQPLEKFQRFISPELVPTHVDDEIAIVGINSARSLTIKSGRVNAEQIDDARKTLAHLPDEILKIIVTHHPFDLPEGTDPDDIVGRATIAISELSDCGVEVFLAGHMHVSGIVDTAKRYKLNNGRSALVIQAGTAASVRGRGETQSFNIIEHENGVLTVSRIGYAGLEVGFRCFDAKRYQRTALGWTKLSVKP
jgi:3',5'-cyclic AMP phosphodiesterase CpdA